MADLVEAHRIVRAPRQRLTCSWKEEHGVWPAEMHPLAIANARQHAPKVRNAALILQRMLEHTCLICGAALTPAKD